MNGIFTYIYPKNDPHVGKYSRHGASGRGYIVSHRVIDLRSPEEATQGAPRVFINLNKVPVTTCTPVS